MGNWEHMQSHEVTIGGSNVFRDDELEDVATAVYEPDGTVRPVTVREVLFGDGSGSPPMGILSGQPAERTESTVEDQGFAREYDPEEACRRRKLKAGLEAAIAALTSKRAESVRREMKRHFKRKAKKGGAR